MGGGGQVLDKRIERLLVNETFGIQSDIFAWDRRDHSFRSTIILQKVLGHRTWPSGSGAGPTSRAVATRGGRSTFGTFNHHPGAKSIGRLPLDCYPIN